MATVVLLLFGKGTDCSPRINHTNNNTCHHTETIMNTTNNTIRDTTNTNDINTNIKLLTIWLLNNNALSHYSKVIESLELTVNIIYSCDVRSCYKS